MLKISMPEKYNNNKKKSFFSLEVHESLNFTLKFVECFKHFNFVYIVPQ